MTINKMDAKPCIIQRVHFQSFKCTISLKLHEWLFSDTLIMFSLIKMQFVFITHIIREIIFLPDLQYYLRRATTRCYPIAEKQTSECWCKQGYDWVSKWFFPLAYRLNPENDTYSAPNKSSALSLYGMKFCSGTVKANFNELVLLYGSNSSNYEETVLSSTFFFLVDVIQVPGVPELIGVIERLFWYYWIDCKKVLIDYENRDWNYYRSLRVSTCKTWRSILWASAERTTLLVVRAWQDSVFNHIILPHKTRELE